MRKPFVPWAVLLLALVAVLLGGGHEPPSGRDGASANVIGQRTAPAIAPHTRQTAVVCKGEEVEPEGLEVDAWLAGEAPGTLVALAQGGRRLRSGLVATAAPRAEVRIERERGPPTRRA